MSCVFGDGNERLTIDWYGGEMICVWVGGGGKIEKASQSKFAGDSNEF